MDCVPRLQGESGGHDGDRQLGKQRETEDGEEGGDWGPGLTRVPWELGQIRERGIGQCNANLIHSFIRSGACFRPGETGRGVVTGRGEASQSDGLQASQRSGRRELGPVCASGVIRPEAGGGSPDLTTDQRMQ